MSGRFVLSRAGVLNVWQYDEQVFEFAGGRLLLRGANGAGKSKTLEMLLPFAIDGDKARITASGRHHTSLLWLMLDGYAGQNRTGYLWVEFGRDAGGRSEAVTCGVGIRAAQSARSATAWCFTVPGRVGTDLRLEDGAGPVARDRLRTAIEPLGGQVFDSPRAYKQHVGRLLFGLEPAQYDELLRLLYWLRQPQVGEDIEPARLAEQLVQALPALDSDAVRAAGETFDELAAFGEQLDRQRRTAAGVEAFAAVYADYAREVLRGRGRDVVEQHRERARRARGMERYRALVAELTERRAAAERERGEAERERRALDARLAELGRDPALRTHRELLDRQELARELAAAAAEAEDVAAAARTRAERSGDRVRRDAGALRAELAGHAGAAQALAGRLGEAGAPSALVVPVELHGSGLARPADAGPALSALDTLDTAVRHARPAVGSLLAAVEAVDRARAELVEATGARRHAEERAGEAEQRAEEERGHLADARREADAATEAYVAAVDGWRGDPRAVTFDLPAELTAETAGSLTRLAGAAAAPPLGRLRRSEAEAAAERTAAEREIEDTRRRRAAVEAETDPAPPEPGWSRDQRDAVDGAPLWRLVDFAEHVRPAERAGIEAALEASGLLDAWIRADGTVLDAGRLDVVLPVGEELPGPTLAGMLRADPPAGGPVTADVVRRVLARVGWGPAEPAEQVGPAERTQPAGPAEAASEDPGRTPDGDGRAVVRGDGSWQLGPLTGRASKPAAQYVGITARSAERARRLAELDRLLADHTRRRDEAAGAERTAREAIMAVEAWLAAVPDPGALLAAWTRLEERVRISERADRWAAAAEYRAVGARSVEAARRRALDQLADVHGLPTEAGSLAARREQLRALDEDLARHAEAAAPLRRQLVRWAEDADAWIDDAADAEDKAQAAAARGDRADAARAAADELEAAAGASIREIRERIDEVERRRAGVGRRIAELGGQAEALLLDLGAARRAESESGGRLAEQEPVVAAAVTALAAVADTPGLLSSGLPHPDPAQEVRGRADKGVAAATGGAAPESPAATGTRATGNPTTGNPTTGNPTTGNPTTGNPTTGNPTTDNPTTDNPTTDNPTTDNPTTDNSRTDDPAAGSRLAAALALARGFAAGRPVPAAVLALGRRFAELAPPARAGTETAVYAAWQDAASGPAADCDPRVVEEAGALAVVGRDDAGEHPVGELAGRLAAAAARDAELLTDRERRLFEEHILGDLGESLRSKRLEADELVTEMNQLLRGVTTSQGIHVQLRWALRDDIAADARRAVELLGEPLGALLPGERRELRDALHRLIEGSRADAPEDSYSEHLGRALDYRRWFAFRIRYTRPETAGTWHDLHRRSPLSQGEQKVVCYLPLFAAAAAHFSSLAGAAPHSPRFVLLDDAFPKIDVRTHPLLFGLLVQLDLDFVITSERLWGDHDTVPSLAIYEALRDPTERGVAQYRHLWDGHRLRAVGA